MKRLVIGMTAAMALALVGSARADDLTKTSESKTTVKKNDDGTSSVKTEKKSKTDPAGAANATTNTSTYTKDTEKDSQGNVVKHEKTGPDGTTSTVK